MRFSACRRPLSPRNLLALAFRHDHCILTNVIYFDHNATSPLCPAASEAWLDAVHRFPANPSSPHRLGARADAALNAARQAVADWLKCSPMDIVWTSGATEANNSLFYHKGLDASGEAWVSAIEHPSALQAARRWFGQRLRLIPVTAAGVVDLNGLGDQLKKTRPSLVAIMAANNETGVLQPWAEALALCRDVEVPFACDASQWVGKLPSAGLGECDFVTGCAHKFGGPVGVGFMKVPPVFRSVLVGGEQEDGRRAGTENVPGVMAMAAAWRQREEQIVRGETAVRESWRDDFLRFISQELAETMLLGAGAKRLWNTAAVLMPPTPDCRRRWVVMLDKQGFAVSTGSACASGKEKASHVVTAMGLESTGDRMLRFSSGWETTEQNWKDLCVAVVECYRRLCSNLATSARS
jgi:cysteine desulfurase